MTVMYLHPEGGGETAGSNAPGAFLVFTIIGGGKGLDRATYS